MKMISFPLRDLWITLKAGTDRLMGKVESNGVYVGKIRISYGRI